MSDIYFKTEAKEDFDKARSKEFIKWILSLLDSERNNLLSLADVRALIKPKKEFYKGMKAVLISDIAGSEGRYRDFNRQFLPKHEHLRARWERVDVAHLKDIVLPPIRLYEVGGTYFVRDGNHRVSVARMKGVLYIDAEIIELDSMIKITPDMSKADLKKKIIEYERTQFFIKTELNNNSSSYLLNFTAPGRYDEILCHIAYHKKYLESRFNKEHSINEAAILWYDNVFTPFAKAIADKEVLSRFPRRTVGDLYVWIERHWQNLQKKYGKDMPIEQAVDDYSEKYGKSLWGIIKEILKKLFKRKK
jgi:hypothetical protein